MNRCFRPFPGVLVDIKNLLAKTEGFLVQVELKLSRRKLLSEGSSPHLMMQWNGFEKVRDNRGYRYLIWTEELHTGGYHFHSYREQLTMACYPSPAANCKELHFSCQPMSIEVETFSPDGSRFRSPDIVGHDFQCKISLS